MSMSQPYSYGDHRAVDYDKLNKVVRRQRGALTRAIKSGVRENVVRACRAAVAEWNAGDMMWPDDWSRWQRALDDMYPVFEAPRLEDLELPQCVLSMKCYCAGHARGNPSSAPCDTSEQPVLHQPTVEQVHDTLEQAIEEVCDVDTRNEISAVYRRMMREQGFVDGNEEDDSE